MEKRLKTMKFSFFLFFNKFTGNRFAINQIKIGIVSLLSRFEVFQTEKTPKIIKYKLDSVILEPKNGLHLGFRERTANI